MGKNSAGNTHKGFGATDIAGQGQLGGDGTEDFVNGGKPGKDLPAAKASWLTQLLGGSLQQLGCFSETATPTQRSVKGRQVL